MAKTEEATTEGKSKKPIVLILVVLILLGASVGGTLYFMGFFNAKEGEDDSEEIKKEAVQQPVYLAFEKPFTINFDTKTGMRFLQIKVEVMAYDQVDLDNVATHMPVLRNNMIFIFSSQKFEDLLSTQGKEKLRADILLDIQKVMQERTGVPGVEDVFFTNFVIQ